jgi:hypothetical protein
MAGFMPTFPLKKTFFLSHWIINHNLEAMAKQLYDYWFVQFDFPDENGNRIKVVVERIS